MLLNKSKLKIAVVGGGIYGICAAIKLAEHHTVHLFEKHDGLLKAASGINQYRLHRGYHYPRSQETALLSNGSLDYFKNEFAGAILEDFDHYYCIAKEHSLISAKQYLGFCKRNNLNYNITNLEVLNKDKIDVCIKVKESLYDIEALRQISMKKLENANVKVMTNKEVKLSHLSSYDFKVVATYANINHVLDELPEHQRDYQFELCEKPVVRLPSSLASKSIVIMDGPFMCVDPLGKTGLSVMGNVLHAIHSSNVGKFPEIEEKYLSLMNNGIIRNPPVTNFAGFIESASEFIPGIRHAEHIGSMFTVRTVLPNVEDTDERPTIINKINDDTITILSGKIGNSVIAANQVSRMIAGQESQSAIPRIRHQLVH